MSHKPPPKNMAELRALIEAEHNVESVNWMDLCKITSTADQEVRKSVADLSHQIQNMGLNTLDMLGKHQTEVNGKIDTQKALIENSRKAFDQEVATLKRKMENQESRIKQNEQDICQLSKGLEEETEQRQHESHQCWQAHTKAQWERANRTLVLSGIPTDAPVEVRKDRNGKDYYHFQKERNFETLAVVRSKLVPKFDLSERDIVEAFRLPKPRNINNDQPPKICCVFATLEGRNAVMVNIRKLKDYGEETKKWHFEADVPATLRDEKKKGSYISYQYRKRNPGHLVRTGFVKDRLVISVKARAEDRWTDLTEDEIRSLGPDRMNLRPSQAIPEDQEDTGTSQSRNKRPASPIDRERNRQRSWGASGWGTNGW